MTKKGRGRQKGFTVTEEQRHNMSLAKKGKPLSQKHREALCKPKSVSSHRKGKKWLNIDGKRVWVTPEEYQQYIKENPELEHRRGWSWGARRKGKCWRKIDGKHVWMTKEEAQAYDQRQ